jgi:hypothetical protein
MREVRERRRGQPTMEVVKGIGGRRKEREEWREREEG